MWPGLVSAQTALERPPKAAKPDEFSVTAPVTIEVNARPIPAFDNRERCLEYVRNSIGLVTALNPVLGYERSAQIAKEALKTGGSVYDLVLEKGWLTRERLDDLLKPENMTRPRQLP